ncbi:MAG: protein jag [Firmicutes bacterium]|nr:protein jag [Bacillota bacterium]
MRYSEKWGDSIESAVALALQDLKLTRDQVTVTVLEEPSKGFFGIGSKLAKVRVEEITAPQPKEEPKPAPQPVQKEKPAEKKAEAPEAEPEKPREEKKKKNNRKKPKNGANKKEFKIEGELVQVSAKPDDLKDAPDHPAKEFLENLIREMGLEGEVKVAVNETSVYADIDGKDTGTIIGKRGQTLDSIQYLTSLVVNKGEDEYIRVVVDAENYRAKREETLEKLAYRLAEKCIKTGRSVRLEPMNPYERKVIHTTLQTVPSVVTRSEGNEPNRRVVIQPAKN